MRRALEFLAPAATILLLLGVWEVACRAMRVPVYLLPGPSQIIRAAAADLPVLAMSAGNTLIMALSALVIASALATSLALALGASPLLERAVKPIAIGFQVTPIVAIAPLAVIWAGLEHSERAIVGLAAIVAFFPVFSGTLTGLKSADPDLERLFDLYGARRWQRLFRLRVPAAVPYILEGHKVAAGQALIGGVVAEFVARTGQSQGLAWRILEASHNLETPRLFAALFTLAVMGGLLFAVLQGLEAVALRWWRGR